MQPLPAQSPIMGRRIVLTTGGYPAAVPGYSDSGSDPGWQ